MGDVLTLRVQPLYTSQNLKKGLASRARSKSRNEKMGLEHSIMAVTFVVSSHYCTEIRDYSIVLYSYRRVLPLQIFPRLLTFWRWNYFFF